MACHREKLASNVKSRGVLLSFFFFFPLWNTPTLIRRYLFGKIPATEYSTSTRGRNRSITWIVSFSLISFRLIRGKDRSEIFVPRLRKKLGLEDESYLHESVRERIGSDRMARDPERRSPILSLSDLCLSWEIVFDNETGETQSKAGGKSRDTRDFHRLLDLQEACSYSRQIYTCWLEGWKHSLNISTWQIRGHVSATWIRMKIQYPPEERSNRHCHSRLIERIERIIRKNPSYEWYKSTTSATDSLILDQYAN